MATTPAMTTTAAPEAAEAAMSLVMPVRSVSLSGDSARRPENNNCAFIGYPRVEPETAHRSPESTTPTFRGGASVAHVAEHAKVGNVQDARRHGGGLVKRRQQGGLRLGLRVARQHVAVTLQQTPQHTRKPANLR